MIGFLLSALLAASTPVNVESSVAILYAQDEYGGQQMKCTATAIAREGDQTVFLTAAHCVTVEEPETHKLVATREPLFLSTDDLTSKTYVRAKIERIGSEKKGYDFAILTSPLNIPTIPIGDERQESLHAELVNVAAPKGIGKVLSFGHVALKFIDRPLFDATSHIDWSGAMLVAVDEVAGGSSGSAIVSRETGKVIGILVGTYGGNLTIAIPASRISNNTKDDLIYIANASGSPGVRKESR